MKALLVIVVVILGTYVGCHLAYPTYTHRYRITLAVEVNGKLRQGSSVMETSGGKHVIQIGDVGAWVRFKGDAVAVDLGDGRYVFAVLGLGDDARGAMEYIAIKAFGDPKCGEPWCSFKLMNQWVGQRRPLSLSLIPMLVTFKDNNDPRSVRLVPLHDFESVFGKGVEFHSAWIELTNDPVTRGVEKLLPWVPEFRGHLGGGLRNNNPGRPIELNLSSFNFRR